MTNRTDTRTGTNLDNLFDSKVTKVIAWTLLGLIVIGGFLIGSGSIDFQSKEEKSIEQQFNSYSAQEQFDACLYFTTTPTNQIAEEGTYNGWTVEETYDIVIPKMDELCGFDGR